MDCRRAQFSIIASVAAVWLSGGAFAQTPITPLERPDPAGLTIPDMNVMPSKRDVGRFDEYYYFHKADISYERAFADLEQCRANGLTMKLVLPPPEFVPLGGEIVKKKTEIYAQGILMMVLARYLLESQEHDLAEKATRRCMAYKGYRRYGTTQTISEQLDSEDVAQSLGKRALVAAHTQPAMEAIEP